MQALAVHAEDHDGLHRSVCGAEPVWSPGAELDGFARFDDEVALAENESHSAGEHISPVLTFVNG